MYRLSKEQRKAVKVLKCEILENERKIAALVRSNELLTIDIADTIAAKPVKVDRITPIVKLLSIYFKPGKTNVDSFLTAGEVRLYLVMTANIDYTIRDIGQGLTRLTKASSTVAKGTFGLKRGYWLKKVKQ